jgi:hypothetical protein
MLARIRELYSRIRVLQRLIQKEMKSKNGLSFQRKWYCYTKGFFSNSYILYDLDSNNYRKYLNDIQENISARHINARGVELLDNKVLFSLFLKPFIPVIMERFIIMSGRLTLISDYSAISNIDLLVEDMQQHHRAYIVKPIDGASGYGIFKISYSKNGFRINGKNTGKEELLKFLKTLHKYLVSDLLRQADYSQTIFPDSINTIRLLTLIDPDTNEAFIAAAAHRIGNSKSAPVDNCAMGGLTAVINIKDGVIGKATSTIVSGPELTWFSHHPDTGAAIEGVVIPGWQEIVKKTLALANNLSFLPFIGWDIVAQDDGITVIEGNDGPDIKLHQVHGPLLADPRIKRFFKHHKVLR